MAIKDLLAGFRAFKNVDGEFGIEIETETLKEYDYPEFYFWTTHGDNSLRNYGVEYVLKQPLKFSMVPDALDEFHKKTEKLNFIKDSFSTSVHVHVNMLNETALTMGNFITLYMLFENLLIRYSGPNRRSNLFCLPTVDAEETFQYARGFFECIQQKDYRRLVLSENAVKYAALNLSALGKYGSLEIRSFRGETDVKEIYRWVEILNSLLTYSRQRINPKLIMEKYKNLGLGFRDEVFGKHAKLLSCPDEEALIEKNVFYAGSIAYCVKSWELLEQKEKFSPTKKQLNDYSIAIFGKPFDDLSGAEQHHVLVTVEKDFITGQLKATPRSKNKINDLQNAWQQIVVAQPQVADF